MTFKEMESIVNYLVHLLKREEVWEVSESNLLKLFDYAMLRLNEDEKRVFENEFLLNNSKEWWHNYYSRTTFYRYKKSAMATFIDCLRI